MALEIEANPIGNQETLAEAEARRQPKEEASSKRASEVAQVERALVLRVTGKPNVISFINRH